eukprot:90632-Chlamydomonas_euryale.AAC.1
MERSNGRPLLAPTAPVLAARWTEIVSSCSSTIKVAARPKQYTFEGIQGRRCVGKRAKSQHESGDADRCQGATASSTSNRTPRPCRHAVLNRPQRAENKAARRHRRPNLSSARLAPFIAPVRSTRRQHTPANASKRPRRTSAPARWLSTSRLSCGTTTRCAASQRCSGAAPTTAPAVALAKAQEPIGRE